MYMTLLYIDMTLLLIMYQHHTRSHDNIYKYRLHVMMYPHIQII